MHAKRIMAKGNVPTAPYRDFYDASMAHSQVEALWKEYGGLVVKADGLCAGKGVYVCKTTDEVHAAIDKLMVKKVHGDAGKAILLEKKIDGPEVSAISLCDASDVKHMPESQDYKPVGENDAGPNTGGMGSFSPVPIVTQEIRALIHHNVMHPTLNAMRSCGTPFGGFLYGGLKLTPDGPMVLEFNARSGDPETQVLLRRMKSDFLEYLIACANNELDRLPPMVTDDRAAVCVVLASEGYGYHDNFPRGKPITGLDDVRRDFGKSVQVFHAGTKFDDNGDLVTNGGRVLGVTALGDTLDEASDIAYQAARLIRFEGKYCRPDIGKKVMERGR
jgi:phosphoribosylamine--glycine ligase